MIHLELIQKKTDTAEIRDFGTFVHSKSNDAIF